MRGQTLGGAPACESIGSEATTEDLPETVVAESLKAEGAGSSVLRANCNIMRVLICVAIKRRNCGRPTTTVTCAIQLAGGHQSNTVLPFSNLINLSYFNTKGIISHSREVERVLVAASDAKKLTVFQLLDKKLEKINYYNLCS